MTTPINITNNNHNSDDVSTDTRSSPMSSSSIPLCSFDNTELNQEADKQILEWASKLELETIGLREKSEVLIDVFNKKRGELAQCVTRLDTLLQRQNEETTSKLTAEIKKNNETQDIRLNELLVKMIRIEDQVATLTTEVQQQKESSKTQKKDDTITPPTEWLLSNVNDQLSQMTCFMDSISKELINVVNRQVKLEASVLNAASTPVICLQCGENKENVTKKTRPQRTIFGGVQTPVPSQPQTITQEPLEKVTYGPMTRARSKRLRKELKTKTTTGPSLSPNNDYTSVPVKGRYSRTLIPWEDINKEENINKFEFEYSSEI